MTMYARLVTFKLGPGKRSEAKKLVESFDPKIRARNGFKSLTFLGDDTLGEYGGLMVYESEADAEAAFEALYPQLGKALTGIAQGPPTNHLFEVLEAAA
jgi:quinol monooxygenase YgiN